jgi:hypothetical protein
LSKVLQVKKSQPTEITPSFLSYSFNQKINGHLDDIEGLSLFLFAPGHSSSSLAKLAEMLLLSSALINAGLFSTWLNELILLVSVMV